LASALAFSRRLFVNGKARANFHVGLDKTAQLHRRHRNWPFYCVTRRAFNQYVVRQIQSIHHRQSGGKWLTTIQCPLSGHFTGYWMASRGDSGDDTDFYFI